MSKEGSEGPVKNPAVLNYFTECVTVCDSHRSSDGVEGAGYAFNLTRQPATKTRTTLDTSRAPRNAKRLPVPGPSLKLARWAGALRSPFLLMDDLPGDHGSGRRYDLHATLAEAKEDTRETERKVNETKIELADRGMQDTLQVDTLRADLETTRALSDCTRSTSPRTAPE
ncbi:hypothetical protein AURDEDRAFT_159581 [Auricularia subglabra TFB-10046 SS5]|nr:hypothetical protein AURDEDRAFT_159581 [Auricularia subglabra TFB-10046 SS5]